MKFLYITLGMLCVVLGAVGIFLPLLPTTPFLLLAAWLWFRSSPELYRRLLENRYLGTYIRNFRENRAIPLRAKIVSVSLVWLTIGYCIICVAEPVWLKALLGLLAAGISWHILSFKTLRG